jgi:alpha-tubulin suppressor-like RCC1 family protein
MTLLITVLQRELAEYLNCDELKYLLENVTDPDPDLEYKVISSDEWWKWIAKRKYNFTVSELNELHSPIWKSILITSCNKIACIDFTSCALNYKGQLYSWGNNSSGQCGRGISEIGININIPTLVPNLPQFKSIHGNDEAFYAITYGGLLYTWGFFNSITMDIKKHEADVIEIHSDIYVIPSPILVANLPPIQDISIGDHFILALTFKGKIYSWGNKSAELGLGIFDDLDYQNDNYNIYTPTLIDSLPPIKAVVTGSSHCMALTRTGKVYSWGSNADGQLGIEYIDNELYTPKLIENLPPIRVISAGYYHSLALATSGELYSWGQNEHFQLGLGKTNFSIRSPELVQNIISPHKIFAGYYNSFVIDKQGKLYSWGNNEYGNLGLGDYGDDNKRSTPTIVFLSISVDKEKLKQDKNDITEKRFLIPTIKSVFAGSNHTLILTDKGKLYACGYNDVNTLGVGDSDYEKIPIFTLVKNFNFY